jgi:hypothetical protein
MLVTETGSSSIAPRVQTKNHAKTMREEVCLDDKKLANNWLATGVEQPPNSSAADEKAVVGPFEIPIPT